MKCKCGRGEFQTKYVDESIASNEDEQRIEETYKVRIREYFCCDTVMRFPYRPKRRFRRGLQNAIPPTNPVLDEIFKDIGKRQSKKVRYLPFVRRLGKKLEHDTPLTEELEELCNSGIIVIEERPNPKVKLHTEWEIGCFYLTGHGLQYCKERYPSKENEVTKVCNDLTRLLSTNMSRFEEGYGPKAILDERYLSLKENLREVQIALEHNMDPVFHISNEEVFLSSSPKRFSTILKVLLGLTHNVLENRIVDTPRFCRDVNISISDFNTYKNDITEIVGSQIMLFGVFKSYPNNADNRRAEELRTYLSRFERDAKMYIVDMLINHYEDPKTSWNIGFRKVSKKCENLLKKKMRKKGISEKEITNRIALLKGKKSGLFQLFKQSLFSDIRTVIVDTDDNWKNVFENEFPMGKDRLRRGFGTIIDLRNSVSHIDFNTKLLNDGFRMLYSLSLITCR